MATWKCSVCSSINSFAGSTANYSCAICCANNYFFQWLCEAKLPHIFQKSITANVHLKDQLSIALLNFGAVQAWAQSTHLNQNEAALLLQAWHATRDLTLRERDLTPSQRAELLQLSAMDAKLQLDAEVESLSEQTIISCAERRNIVSRAVKQFLITELAYIVTSYIEPTLVVIERHTSGQDVFAAEDVLRVLFPDAKASDFENNNWGIYVNTKNLMFEETLASQGFIFLRTSEFRTNSFRQVHLDVYEGTGESRFAYGALSASKAFRGDRGVPASFTSDLSARQMGRLRI